MMEGGTHSLIERQDMLDFAFFCSGLLERGASSALVTPTHVRFMNVSLATGVTLQSAFYCRRLLALRWREGDCFDVHLEPFKTLWSAGSQARHA